MSEEIQGEPLRPSDEARRISETRSPAFSYDAWDRDEDATAWERVAPRKPEGLLGSLETTKPARFPASVLWAGLYFCVALFFGIVILVVGQLIPAVVGIIGVFAYAAATGVNLSGPNTMKQLTEMSIMPTLALSQIFTIGFSLLALLIVLGWHWPRRVGLRLPSLWHFVLTLLVFPALLLLANGAYAVAKDYLPGISDLGLPGMEEMVKLFGTWPWWLAVLIIGVGPALGEELWCRGFLGLGLLGRNGVVSRMLISSFFFGLIHVDPRQGSMAALMGLFLYFVYVTTRSLLMPMLVHCLNNSTSVIAARFEGADVIDQHPERIPWILYVGAGVLLVALLVCLYRTRARLVTDEGDTALWRPTYAGVEHPPPHAGVRVSYPRSGLVDAALLLAGLAAFGGAIAAAVYLY